MSGRIPREFIDELLVRVDIVDLINSKVPLKKTGDNFIARCPFHAEKTPSFSVNRKKQFFYCFGCGASGNALSFLMDFNHLRFREAVEDLAVFVGLELPKESTDEKQKSDESVILYELMGQVADFYVEKLRQSVEGKRAADYLKSRGIGSDCAAVFSLGYAPNEWMMLSSRFDQSMLAKAGLLVIKNHGGGYDRFRDRVMFPIRDRRGRVLGFGGRVLGDETPKYLNSPETALFHKGKEVYGLYELLNVRPNPQRIIVVEGYLDVIALNQCGIDYAVATLGTATSQEHFNLLFRFSTELILCFDGDKAGREAAWKAVLTALPCLKTGRQIRIMLLPEQHDPDTLVREEGIDSFVKRMENAELLSEFFFKHFSSDLNLTQIEYRANLVNKTESYLKQLPVGAFRDMMIEKLSQLSRQHITDNESILAYKKRLQNIPYPSGRPSLPGFLAALLVQYPWLIDVLEQKDIDWEQLEFEGVDKFRRIFQLIAEKKPANYGLLLELCRDHEDGQAIRKLASLEVQVSEEKIEEVFCDALDRLLVRSKDARLARLLKKGKLNDQEKEQLRNLLMP